MNTPELIEIARELGAHHYLDTFEKECICFVTEELQQFVQRIERPHLQRILELTQRAEKVADSLEQAEKRLTEIAFKACANLDTKDAQISQLREALEKIADLDGNWGPFPETNKQWCAMVIVTAREALEETK